MDSKLQKISSRSNHILESISDGFIAIDNDWNYIYINEQAAELSGNRKEELLGHNMFSVHEDFRTSVFYRHYKKAFDNKEVVKFEYYYSSLHRWYAIHAYPFHDGLSVYFNDITNKKEYERRLRESEELARLVVEEIKDYAIFMLDTEGRVMSWNKGAERITGFQSRDVIGENFSCFFPPNEPGLSERELSRAAKEGRTEHEGWRLRKDGSLFWASESITALYTDKGKLRGYSEVIRDMTDRKQTEEMLSRYTHDLELTKKTIEREKAIDEALLQSIGEGVVVTDENQRVVLINTQAQIMLDCKEIDALGRFFWEVWNTCNEEGKSVPISSRPLTIAFESGKKVSKSNFFYVSKKKSFPVATTSAPVVFRGKNVGVITVFRDISKEREIDRAKSEFVSLASHQLRTPLTSIKLLVEMLKSDGFGELNKAQKKVLESIEQSNEKMIHLVENILNISQLNKGKLRIKLEMIELNSFIGNLVNDARVLAQAKNCMIHYDSFTDRPVRTAIDPTLMRQVINNVIANAIQYSYENTTITVELLQEHKKEYIVKVTDQGIGISMKDRNKLFDRFFRAENAVKQHKSSGTGLGLYMCRMVMAALGGRIWFTSKLNKGSTFFIAIPAKKRSR